MTEFPSLILVLTEGGVRFIVAGGFAATVHGSARLTQDLDVVYDRSSENLTKMTATIGSLNPTLRGAPADLPVRLDVPTLQAGLNFTLSTRLGALDLLGQIAGGRPRDLDALAELEIIREERRRQ